MQLMWFRHDLRGVDNKALQAAVEQGGPVIALYVHSPKQMERHCVGERRQWFHLQHVASLFKSLSKSNIHCVYRETGGFEQIPAVFEGIIQQLQQPNLEEGHKPFESVFFHREVGFWEEARDDAVRALCASLGVTVHSLEDDSILAPDQVRQKSGAAYKVFTPYKKAWYVYLEQAHLPVFDQLPKVSDQSSALQMLDTGMNSLEARIQQLESAASEDFQKLWPIGEVEAQRRLELFQGEPIARYADQRDLPAISGTSTLSPYLASGVVSARALFVSAREKREGVGRDTWLSELIWRDFYRQVMVRFPRVSKNRCFNAGYDEMIWRESSSDLEAWKAGRTGVPLVDAGMRQLKQTGWMHNRVRMVTAMFFSKNLFLDWRLGERYFMDQLIDGDFASNNGGWQWSASVGTDAAPYFRVFNPFTQAERFDPECHYIRQFVPELAQVDRKVILQADKHQGALRAAGYSGLIVDVKQSRQVAIEAFKGFKKA